jgi:two-component system cell cycle response regulator
MAKTLLIADDDVEMVRMLQKDLEQAGYAVWTANNGMAVLQMVKQQHFDLIILDVAMPISTGLQAFEMLRSFPDTERTPVIFLSGRPSAEVYPTVEKNARVAHMKKPIDLDDLLSVIRQFVN